MFIETSYKRILPAMLFGLILVSVSVPVAADLPELIPREVLFGNPEKAVPQISPDGTRIAYLAPEEDVLNVWIRSIGKEDDVEIDIETQEETILAAVQSGPDRNPDVDCPRGQRSPRETGGKRTDRSGAEGKGERCGVHAL